MLIRTEIGIDAAGIHALIARSTGSENRAEQIRQLREQGLLTLGVVATDDNGQILGYTAFSPVTFQGEDRGWVMIATLVVDPDYKFAELDRALIYEGLDSLNEFGYSAVVADIQPEWFATLGFSAAPALLFSGTAAGQRLLVYGLQDQRATQMHGELTLPLDISS